jgi:hypothetical protein
MVEAGPEIPQHVSATVDNYIGPLGLSSAPLNLIGAHRLEEPLTRAERGMVVVTLPAGWVGEADVEEGWENQVELTHWDRTFAGEFNLLPCGAEEQGLQYTYTLDMFVGGATCPDTLRRLLCRVEESVVVPINLYKVGTNTPVAVRLTRTVLHTAGGSCTMLLTVEIMAYLAYEGMAHLGIYRALHPAAIRARMAAGSS